MQNFKIGKSRFSRFINGKGFYIALALCLVAIGAAAYVAANSSLNAGVSVSDTGDSDILGINTDSTTQVGVTLSDVEAGSSTSQAASSSASTSSKSAGSSSAASTASLSETAPTIYLMPVDGDVITDYSNGELVYDKTMDDWRVHNGIDIAAKLSTPVKACADGIVQKVYMDDMYGEVVVIGHGGGITSIYAGLTTGVSVKAGDAVEAGDVIGAVGDTAECEVSLEPHLHFAMMKDGVYVDPLITMGKSSR